MLRFMLALSLLTTLFFPVTALAQAAPSDATAQPQDPAWIMYQSAFADCAAGRTKQCKQTLRSIQRDHPQHPAATMATRSLDDLSQLSTEDAVKKMRQRGPSGEEYTLAARAELISYQTIHGAFVGGELCAFADCGERTFIASIMVGAGLGFGLSYLGTQEGITAGRALALNSGVSWGAWSGLMLNSTLSISDDKFWLTMLGAQGLGMGVGYLYSLGLTPTGGQVALTNSGGLWTMVASLLMYGIASDSIELDNLSTVALLTSNLGLLAGGVLGHYFPISRSRVSIIDSATLLGGLTGLGTAALIRPDNGETYLAMTMVAGLAGMATSAYFTQDWDDDDEDVLRKKRELTVDRIGLAPMIQQDQMGNTQRGLGVTIAGHW